MKQSTLNIIFSEPDVFSVLLDHGKKENGKLCRYVNSLSCNISSCKCSEQSRANAIRIENPELVATCFYNKWFLPSAPDKTLKHGDIFHVEGFEYEVNKRGLCDGTCNDEYNKSLPCGSCRTAFLKIAKEEEQEPDIQTSDIHHTFKPHGQFKAKEEEPKEQKLAIYVKGYYNSDNLRKLADELDQRP